MFDVWTKLPSHPDFTAATLRFLIKALELHIEFSKGLSKQENQLLHLVEVEEVGYEAAGQALNMTLEEVKLAMLDLRLRRNRIIFPE